MKKGANTTVLSMEDTLERPILGRRKTPIKEVRSSIDAQNLEQEGPEDGLTKVGNFLW